MRNEDQVERVQSILGFGLDDAGGHIRMTEGKPFSLLMGSKNTHDEMLRVIQELDHQAAEIGKTLSDLTRDEIIRIAQNMERAHNHRFPEDL